MKKTINKAQLEKLVESATRSLINSKGSCDLDRSNPSDNEIIKKEMDNDWEELDKTNNRFKAQKNPLLANKYNWNVYDGREEAEAYTDGLEEAKIRKFIKKCVNEALNGRKGLFTAFDKHFIDGWDSFIYYDGNFYHTNKDNEYDLRTREGRNALLDDIEKGVIPQFDTNSEADGMSVEEFYSWLKSHGYQTHDFNANAF